MYQLQPSQIRKSHDLSTPYSSHLVIFQVDRANFFGHKKVQSSTFSLIRLRYTLDTALTVEETFWHRPGVMSVRLATYKNDIVDEDYQEKY